MTVVRDVCGWEDRNREGNGHTNMKEKEKFGILSAMSKMMGGRNCDT